MTKYQSCISTYMSNTRENGKKKAFNFEDMKTNLPNQRSFTVSILEIFRVVLYLLPRAKIYSGPLSHVYLSESRFPECGSCSPSTISG